MRRAEQLLWSPVLSLVPAPYLALTVCPCTDSSFMHILQAELTILIFFFFFLVPYLFIHGLSESPVIFLVTDVPLY